MTTTRPSTASAIEEARLEPPRWHVVVRVGRGDRYRPDVGRRDRVLELVIDGSGASGRAAGVIAHNIWDRLDAHSLVAPSAAVDFFRAAAAVYAADGRVARRAAYDGWTRELILHVPVSDPDRWARVGPLFADAMAFLTGDQWEVVPRALTGSPVSSRNPVGRPPIKRRVYGRGGRLSADAVCLLSGGLDSLAGAVDLLDAGRKLAFVSHNTAGSERFTSRSQDGVVGALATGFGRSAFGHLKFRVAPPPTDGGDVENTQRSRSIIFIALGVITAASLAQQNAAPGARGGESAANGSRTSAIPLFVPENGFISLNVPLTPSRLGSCSTRTTHPYTMHLVGRVLDELGLDVPLELPYHTATKGEMLTGVASRRADVLSAGAPLSNSCARPNDRNADPARPQAHCGYCVPCIIRRAALATVGLDRAAHYRYDVLTERALLEQSDARRSDVRAFEIALARAKRRRPGVSDVLRAGPLPMDAAEIAEAVAVYRRGLDEVAKFLLGRTVTT